MKVFISWSGEPAKQLATALRDWLGDTVQSVDPWMSEEDIAKGTWWGSEVAEALQTTSYGLVCVTRENQDRPWLNFEAGALSKIATEARVWTVVLDLPKADVKPPLGQFNATDIRDEADVRRLVKAINAAVPQPLTDAAMRRQFDRTWHELEGKIAAIELSDTEAAPDVVERPLPEILAELLELAREQKRGVAQAKVVSEPNWVRQTDPPSSRFARPLPRPLDREENDAWAIANWLAERGLEAQKIRQSGSRIEILASFPADIEASLKNFCARRGLTVEFYSPTEERLLGLDGEDNTGAPPVDDS